MNKLIRHILDNNIAVNCRTEEDAKELLRLAHESGLKWSNDNSYIEFNFYLFHKEKTCYDIKNSKFCHLEYFKVCNVEIVEYQELKKQLEINETQNKETVLEVEFVDVFERHKAWRIVKQDDEIFKRGKFEDEDIRVYSGCVPYIYKNNDFYIKGSEKHGDNNVGMCTNEQAEIIKEKVRLINEKYGRPKFDAEEEYKKLKGIEFTYYSDNYYIYVDDDGFYNYSNLSYHKQICVKYISKEDAEEFCRRANGEK